MQVRYDARADRVLWQVRTRAGELFAIWLTRRMVARFWPPFERLVAASDIAAQVGPGATLVPEAQQMLARAARERPLPQANFEVPFDPRPSACPLGPEPLLPLQIDLNPIAESPPGLSVRIKEGDGGRRLDLRLGGDLATALLRLMEKAIDASDWGLATAAPAAVPAAAPSTLN